MKKFIPVIILLASLGSPTSALTQTYGVVVTPVADLIGSPIQTFFPDMSVDTAYQQLVLCGAEKKLWIGCPRLHQLIAHELVEVLDQTTE